jgi:hypothetical protein
MREVESTELSLSPESVNTDPLYFEIHAKLIDIQTGFAHGNQKNWPHLHLEAARLIQKIETALKKRPLVLHPESHSCQLLKSLITEIREIEQKTSFPRAA